MGIAVGKDVGIDEGAEVGTDVGIAEGSDVGTDEGAEVGTDEGIAEGSDVGTPDYRNDIEKLKQETRKELTCRDRAGQRGRNRRRS